VRRSDLRHLNNAIPITVMEVRIATVEEDTRYPEFGYSTARFMTKKTVTPLMKVARNISPVQVKVVPVV
jgi:hypothetical protein